MNHDLIPAEYLPTLNRVVSEARANGGEECRTDAESRATVASIQEALRHYDHSVTCGEAEEIYRMYSQNKWASWITGGCQSASDAQLMLKEFCHDILYGENHIGL